MPLLVVDSSVAVKWFVVEPYSDQAVSILEDYSKGTTTFLAPDLIYPEFGNIIWKKQQFQGLDVNDGQEIVQAFCTLSLEITPSVDLVNDAYTLAKTHRRTVYDMLYLALSIRENCSFVTADEKLVNAIKAHFQSVVWLGHWT